MLNRFKWNSTRIKYLGILITKDTTKLFDSNYDPVNKTIKSDIDRWSQLPLEIHNRVDTIKMNMLPHFLYLFQSLPVELPLKQFREWDKWISRFIWRGRRPRIKFKTLQLSKENGGRALPCLLDYYKSAQLRLLVCCCNPNYIAKWTDLKISQLAIPL